MPANFITLAPAAEPPRLAAQVTVDVLRGDLPGYSILFDRYDTAQAVVVPAKSLLHEHM